MPFVSCCIITVLLVTQYSDAHEGRFVRLNETEYHLKNGVVYTGPGEDSPISGSNTNVKSIIPFNDHMFMLASNDGGPNLVWRHEKGKKWIPCTGTNTAVFSLWKQRDELLMHAANDQGNSSVWRFDQPGKWKPWTGSNTNVKSVVAIGDSLFIAAANDGKPFWVWEHAWKTHEWTPLTGHPTQVEWLSQKEGRPLMGASNDNESWYEWHYSGGGWRQGRLYRSRPVLPPRNPRTEPSNNGHLTTVFLNGVVGSVSKTSFNAKHGKTFDRVTVFNVTPNSIRVDVVLSRDRQTCDVFHQHLGVAGSRYSGSATLVITYR